MLYIHLEATESSKLCHETDHFTAMWLAFWSRLEKSIVPNWLKTS